MLSFSYISVKASNCFLKGIFSILRIILLIFDRHNDKIKRRPPPLIGGGRTPVFLILSTTLCFFNFKKSVTNNPCLSRKCHGFKNLGEGENNTELNKLKIKVYE